MPSPLKVKVQYLKPWDNAPTITYSSQNPVSDSRGNANLIITIRGADKYGVNAGGHYIDHFGMFFDRANGRYATEIEVYQYREYTLITNTTTKLLSSVKATNADLGFAWHSDAPSPVYDEGYANSSNKYFIEVHIKKWSVPNANIIIDSVTGEYEVEYTKTKIREASRDYKSKAELGQPSFGVISQDAKCRVVDYDESILALSRLNTLEEGLTVTYTLGSKKIGEFVSANWDYNVESHEVTMNLNDRLLALQKDDEVNAVATLASDDNRAETMLDVIDGIATQIGQPIYYSAQLKSYASEVYAPSTYYTPFPVQAGGRWSDLDKFCKNLHLHLYEGTEGITIDKAYINKGNTPISIPAHRISSTIKNSPIRENKYSNVRWTIDGETYEINSDPTNIFEMEAGELTTDIIAPNKATGTSYLHSQLAQEIYDRYRRGIETMEFTVLVPSENDFIELGAVVKPLKRNGQPIVDKNFIVVDAGYVYNGTHQQKLKLEQI